MKNLHVVVLAGGLSAERDVSLRSGRRVAEVVKEQGHDVEIVDVDVNLLSWLKKNKPDCVIPVVHGAVGEDGALRDVLDNLKIPYVGSTGPASRITFDKAIAKTIISKNNIATADSIALPHTAFRELGADVVLDAIVEDLKTPLVVKPVRGGSALGVSVVKSRSEIPAAMVNAFSYDSTALVEKYISGVELAVSVVEDKAEPRALPIVEIKPVSGIYDYSARYTAGMVEFFTPARISGAEKDLVTKTAIEIYKLLGLRDWSRIDVILSDEKVWFLEATISPGLTETSLLPIAADASDAKLGVIVNSLINKAISR
jgi:D-alanine-D-alanine ligase